MSVPVSFKKEEIDELNAITSEYQKKLIDFGQIHLSRLQIDERLNELKKLEDKTKSEYLALQKREEEFLKKITDKYGEGNLDIKSGLFTPNN